MKRLLHNPNLYIAALFSIVFSYLIDVVFLQSPFATLREGGISSFILIASFGILFFLLQTFFTPSFRNNPHKTGLIAVSAVGASLLTYLFAGLIFDWRLVPVQSVELEAMESAEERSAGNLVRVLSYETNFGIRSFNELTFTPGWIRTSKSSLENKNLAGEKIAWSGKPGAFLRFTFSTGPESGSVRIRAEDEESLLNLFSPVEGEIVWERAYPIPQTAYAIPLFAIWVGAFGFLLLLSPFLLPFQPPQRSAKPFPWQLYALPMVGVWTFYLFTFWPGVMSPDSMVQWGQVISGRFNDTHPAIHTMILWAVNQVWGSPAAIALIQILLLSFSIAWGLGILADNGLNRFTTWFLAMILALSPVNSTIVISIWKDIPYSILLFLFSLQIFRIILTKGGWLQNWKHCLALLLTGLGVMLFRHNGIPVPFLSLLLIALFFRQHFARLAIIAVGMIGLWLIIRGPIYGALGVQKEGGLENANFIHHISAHVVTGKPLTGREQQLADILLPQRIWDYNCCRIDETDSVPGFSFERLAEYTPEVRELFISLALKDPQLELRHMVCASQIVWSFRGSCGMVVTRLIGHNQQITANPYGLVSQSKIPAANVFLTKLFNTMFFLDRINFYWYPILYLVMVLAGSILYTIWYHIRYGFLFAVPSLVQSAVLAVVSLNAGDFRYQYGVYLVGMLSIGLIIASVNRRFQAANPSD